MAKGTAAFTEPKEKRPKAVLTLVAEFDMEADTLEMGDIDSTVRDAVTNIRAIGAVTTCKLSVPAYTADYTKV